MRGYRIELAERALENIAALSANQRTIVMRAIAEQLEWQPAIPTRNRKLMSPNPIAEWELRVADLRVYYDVEESPERVVGINAVGWKVRNKVFIGGQEFQL